MKRLICVLLLTASPALAQEPPSTAIDRVAVSLGRCISLAEQRADLSEQRATEINDLRKQLAAAQARVKELEPKKE